MVSITKRPSSGTNTNATLLICNKKRITVAIIVLVLIGMHCISWVLIVVVSTRRGDLDGDSSEGVGMLDIHNNHPRLRIMQQKHKQEIEKQQHPQQRAKSILVQLEQLSKSIPLSSSSSNARQVETNGAQTANNQQQQTSDRHDGSNSMESKFLSNVRKECIPGRDDSKGEINPTTHRQRECLRHVPAVAIGKHNNGNHNKKNGDAGGLPADEEDRNKQLLPPKPKPRIGLMFPPGYIGQSFAHWIADALNQSRSGITSSAPPNLDIELDILTTSHVPVYGYGKSHGYTKIIRFVTLPLTLATQDAYLHELSSSSSSPTTILSSSGLDSTSLRDALEIMKLGTNNIDMSSPTLTTTDTMGSLLQLILRWHCRLSHVSAHTAMLTLSLEDVLSNPTTVLTNVLSFIWRDDWEWEEDRGSGKHPPIVSSSDGNSRDWNAVADNLVGSHGGSLQNFLDVTSLILNETISLVGGNNEHALLQSIQDAFASEMDRSSGMTVWPCPSFWEGLDEEEDDGTKPTMKKIDHDEHNEMQVLRRIADDMVPNCIDDDPFVRCTVNKDRCEVKRNAKCT